jgi:hypothetical protein
MQQRTAVNDENNFTATSVKTKEPPDRDQDRTAASAQHAWIKAEANGTI